MLGHFIVSPVHGCYGAHQFHHYVVTGEMYANDNISAKSQEIEIATDKLALIEQLIDKGRE